MRLKISTPTVKARPFMENDILCNISSKTLPHDMNYMYLELCQDI